MGRFYLTLPGFELTSLPVALRLAGPKIINHDCQDSVGRRASRVTGHVGCRGGMSRRSGRGLGCRIITRSSRGMSGHRGRFRLAAPNLPAHPGARGLDGLARPLIV